MGKHTDNKNKSFKKKYSFTGQRIIGDLKSKIQNNESNTTD